MNTANNCQKVAFFYIQGQVINESDPLKGRVLAFWTKSGWCTDVKSAKKYKSEKVAKNAISSLSNAIFNQAIEVEIKPFSFISKNKTKTPSCHNYPSELRSGKVSYHYCYPREYDGDEDWSEDDDYQRHQGKIY